MIGVEPFLADATPAPHDLLRISGPEALERDAARPAWADEALRTCPWVVVRRASARHGFLPVGIRGACRRERWAAWMPAASVLGFATPQSIAKAAAWRRRDPRLPAIAVLDAVADVLAGLDWGPAGSVGFELATGFPAAHADSDLDVVVAAPRRIDDAVARHLGACLSRLEVRVDLAFQTPIGSISLAELTGPSALRAIKTAHGPRLVGDPWSPLGAPA